MDYEDFKTLTEAFMKKSEERLAILRSLDPHFVSLVRLLNESADADTIARQLHVPVDRVLVAIAP